jgi:hypothetical protein
MAKKRGKMETSGAVLASGGAPAADEDGPQYVSINVRRISNGYVSTHSRKLAGEEPEYKEEFHAKKPTIEELVAGEPRDKETPPGANHLRGAIGLLNQKRGN